MATSDTPTAAWLVADGRVLASVETTPTRASRRRGLVGRTTFEGALAISPCRWVHTVGLRFPIDVAYLDRDGVVVKTVRMSRRRVGAPVPRARTVVEAAAGSFGRWGVRVGDRLEIRLGS